VSLSMTAIARCTSSSSLVRRHVSRTSLCCCCCCFMTAAAWPSQRVGGGTPECRMHERVFAEGGADRAAVVATCAQVLMHVVGLVGGRALRSCDACCLHWRLRLDDSVINVVGLWLDLVVVATRSTLLGLTVGITVGALGIGACNCMDCVICLLSLVGGMGMLAGAFTLGTRCVLQKWSGVLVSLNWWGFVCM
jgi:hypothetical protein